MPVDHYENFPVASFLLPKRLRRPVEAIYRFARSADDIADEGDASDAERLRDLAEFDAELDRIERGEAPLRADFQALAPLVEEWGLPIQLFRDLLDAFSQDVVKKRYADYDELLDYARRSANPVGRLLLHLVARASGDSFSGSFMPRRRAVDSTAVRQGESTKEGMGRKWNENLSRSDCICSSLQLINFWQDIALDWRKGRVYIPQDALSRFSIDERQIAEARWSPEWAALMDFLVDHARNLMLEGAPLVRDLPGRMGIEIRLTVQGGLRILERIRAARGDIFRRRPTLGTLDWLRMGVRAVSVALP
ncbi:MAG: phytoene/squalene synthase family protein [Candidatus Accumulibacter sp.]|jgi:phytoene/squalene synthetase|nr:phytoene/squalene synthase family protein [Accumulibacter sp.]